jgi:hypothetical protein
MKKATSLLLALLIFLSIIVLNSNIASASGYNIKHYKALNFTDPLYIPSIVSDKSANGYDFVDKYWVDGKYHVVVYGTEDDVNKKKIVNDRVGNEYRYLGFDKQGNPLSNLHFPNDASSEKPLAEKNWLFRPWDYGLCQETIFSESLKLETIINDVGLPKPTGLGWSPNVSEGEFFLWGNVQSMPTLLKAGSFRMWHQASDGKIWYQTFDIPKLGSKKDTPFKVTTEILSNDFTIAEDETTVDVSVKVTAKLEDEVYYCDEIDKILYYTRNDIKKWDLKVEYKGTEQLVTLNPNVTNTATNTFTIKLSRSQIVDKENVLFTGVGRVTFHNDKYYRDSDPKTAQFTVIPNIQPLPPDLTITAPAKVNVKESYTVKVNPVVPQGESIKTIILEAGVNGGAYQPITLSSYSASQQYNNTGTINYRAIVTLNNNKTATATAATSIVDERSLTATARIEQPSTAYEGYWLTVRNKNTFIFEDTTYNAQQASDLGLGSSDFEIQDNSQYTLENNLFQTRSYDSNVSFEIRYMQPGQYKNTIWAFPRNGDAVSDTRGIQIMRCPAIIASVDGTRKSNRKMTLDFSRTVVHPDYPLVDSKTYAIIEDTVTGEKVTVTNSVYPDSTNIKTNALSGNKMDFLIKTSVDRIYKVTIYIEDSRGNNDIHTIIFTVVQDRAPIARISTKAQELRKPSLSNKAEIFLQDDSYSEDGDYVTRTWEVAIDTNNNGFFTDETYKAVNLLDGYQDLSGDNSRKKVRFLKTGVGLVDARVKVKEVFGQPTIDEFVTMTDRKEAFGNKTIDVINVAPVVDFKIFSNVPATINIVAGSMPEDLQTAVQDFVPQLQSQLISSRINPAINFIPVSLNTDNPVWNQEGGNPQKTGMSKFNSILNTNVKWQYTTNIVLNDQGLSSSQLLIMPDGNLFSAIDTASGSSITILSPNGVVLCNAILPKINTYYNGNYAMMSGGNILRYSRGKQLQLYDNELNLLKTYDLPVVFNDNSIIVDNDNYIHIAGYSYNSSSDNYSFYLYILNPDLTVKLFRKTPYDYYSWVPLYLAADCAGNSYIPSGGYMYKYDINGNLVWSKSIFNGHGIDEIIYDESTNSLFAVANFSDGAVIHKINADTGNYTNRLFERNVYGSLRKLTLTDTELLITGSDTYRMYCFSKISLQQIGDLGGIGWSVEKSISSKDGAIFNYSRVSDDAKLFRTPFGTGFANFNNYNGSNYVVSSSVFASNNTLYLVACNWFRNVDDYARCSGNMFVIAYGTGGTEQNTDNTLRKLNDYISSDNTIDFTVSITDTPYQDNTDANITNTANLLKNNNDRFLLIGSGSSKSDGQRILDKGVAGSLFNINSNMSIPMSGVSDYIINTLAAPGQKVYEYYYKKGDIINYDVFYTDYELDPSKSSQWRYYHTPKTDGTIVNNGTWLSSPITQFTKNGTYRVQHMQADNTGVTAYDRNSNVIELVIYVEDGTVIPPPETYTPEASITLEGYNKQNRKLTLKLNYSANNSLPLNISSISWTLAPVSGMTEADIRKSSMVTQNIDTLYKKSGRVSATCTFRDTNGNTGSTTAEFDITPDLAPAGTLRTTPVTYRNSSSIATINVKADVTSPDDYFASLKYYITYDADNNGSCLNDSKTYLPQYDNLREFNIDVNTGVGSYLIQLDAKEGFQEPTIPAYIAEADYLTLALQNKSVVDNISPAYDIRPEKNIYLTGEEIRFKAYDGSFLNGDASKGFFDTERDPMTGFSIKYMQNKAIMPSQDSTSAYHNVLGTAFANSLDRAGEYTIDINAFDDPKDGDARFDTFKKPSNTCSNTIIVHRRPVAALSLVPSHATAAVCDFGGNIYLDGTNLRITDASADPDGFNVVSNISYKIDSGDYVRLDSGDMIGLSFGSIYTVKVVTADNWGANDTAIYTIMAANGLDMLPEVIPYSRPASESITLRLTTNQYATSARTVVFGQNLVLPLKSQTASQKIWETGYTIPATRADAVYTAQFYAVSEGFVEIRKDVKFEVATPINLVPDMPAQVVENTSITINAATSIYANTTTVRLFSETAYQTSALSMTDMINGSSKNWRVNYTISADIPVGDYTARFTSTTPNGNTQTRDVAFRVESLKITDVTISGYWNHWRGQVDIFGKQMSIEPHRFLSLEKVRIDVHTIGFADRIDIGFSPALESMQFTDQNGNQYDYFHDYGLQYVYFPASFNLDGGLQDNHLHWEYTLPLAPSTVGWDDTRKTPHYYMTVTARKGEYSDTYTVSDIDITGNIYDLTYIQPVD